MATKLTFTQGDRLASVPLTLADAAGAPIDLTGLTVTFRMVEYWTKAVFIAAGTATKLQTADPATRGRVRYDWQAGETDTAGLYEAWFVASNGALAEHFPVDGPLLIRIDPAY